MLEQWYELQEFDRFPSNHGPTLAQLEAIGVQVMFILITYEDKRSYDLKHFVLNTHFYLSLCR